MKILIIILLTLFTFSCVSVKNVGELEEDNLFITRKYIGNFYEYQCVKPEKFGNPHIILITTKQDTINIKISAYSRKCEFIPGERLYIKRTYVRLGGSVFGDWTYRVENDTEKPIYYDLFEFEFGDKILTQTWY